MEKDGTRSTSRYNFAGVPCLVTFDTQKATISAEIINASENGAFLYASDSKRTIQYHTKGNIILEYLKVPFEVVRSGKSPFKSAYDQLWFAVRFLKASPAFLKCLIDIDLHKDSEQIRFLSRHDIIDLSFLEVIIPLIAFHQVLHSSTHILFVLREKYHVEIGRISSPRIIKLNATSPLKGIIETAKDVVSVVKTADDLIRHRDETKKLKKEEVKQARERTQQEKQKTSKEIATADIASIDALFHESIVSTEVLAKRIEAYKKNIELSHEEISLFREKLAALKDTWQFGKEVFGENSEEIKILQSRLLPAMLFLVEDNAGLHLEFDSREKLLKGHGSDET